MQFERTRRIALSGLVVLALGAGAAQAFAAPTPPVDPTTASRSIDEAAQAVLREYGVPGMALAITRDGRQQFYSYGEASRQTQAKVSRDTLFESWASCR
ncbi:hypothetical protein G6F65_015604 [Rhizopus arrhizus]|nr:hypothetical protein G6F65_015604 [Rhizopus arrhizus]